MALALTGRRRAWAAAVSVLAAVALAVGVVGRGCGVEEPGPDTAVRSLLAAASAGDRQAFWTLLSPDTQAKLEDRARRATELGGSNVRYDALDLISIGSTEEVPPPTEIHVIERHGERAVVEIVSGAGRARLEVVQVDGQWRIDLPGYGADP